MFGKSYYVVEFLNEYGEWEEEQKVSELISKHRIKDVNPPGRRGLVLKSSSGKIKTQFWDDNFPLKKKIDKTSPKKPRDPVEALQAKVKSVAKELDSIKELSEMMGSIGKNDDDDKFSEYLYPNGVFEGFRKSIAHALMTGMEKRDEEVASKALNLFGAIGNSLNAIPMLILAFAKMQGVDIGDYEAKIVKGAMSGMDKTNKGSDTSGVTITEKKEGSFEIDFDDTDAEEDEEAEEEDKEEELVEELIAEEDEDKQIVEVDVDVDKSIEVEEQEE